MREAAADFILRIYIDDISLIPDAGANRTFWHGGIRGGG